MSELKFIIAKRYGHLIHLKGYNRHFDIARDNHLNYYTQVIETGIIQDKRLLIIECRIPLHLAKSKNKSIEDNINRNFLKGREAQALYDYGYIKNGD